jgi:hypothetical protein
MQALFRLVFGEVPKHKEAYRSVHVVSPSEKDLRDGILPYHLMTSAYFKFRTLDEKDHALTYFPYGITVSGMPPISGEPEPTLFLMQYGTISVPADPAVFKRVHFW